MLGVVGIYASISMMTYVRGFLLEGSECRLNVYGSEIIIPEEIYLKPDAKHPSLVLEEPPLHSYPP